MKERLKKIRHKLGFSQNEMAEKLNIPVRIYRNYEYVVKNYPAEFVKSLVDVFCVNTNYLYNGIGEMFICKNTNSVIKQNEKNFNTALQDMTTIGSRFRQIRNEKNLTQSEFGEVIGLTKQTIASVENNHSNPSIECLSKLIEKFNINTNWLITGQGEKYNLKNDFIKYYDFTLKLKELLTNEGLI